MSSIRIHDSGDDYRDIDKIKINNNGSWVNAKGAFVKTDNGLKKVYPFFKMPGEMIFYGYILDNSGGKPVVEYISNDHSGQSVFYSTLEPSVIIQQSTILELHKDISVHIEVKGSFNPGSFSVALIPESDIEKSVNNIIDFKVKDDIEFIDTEGIDGRYAIIIEAYSYYDDYYDSYTGIEGYIDSVIINGKSLDIDIT